MAYMSSETVKEIRKMVKAEFPARDGWKFSITNRDNSGVAIAVMQSPFDFMEYLTEDAAVHYQVGLEMGYVQVNEFNIPDTWKGSARYLFTRLLEIVELVAGKNEDRNAGDVYADYSNWNYYVWLSIGKWDKPWIPADRAEDAPKK